MSKENEELGRRINRDIWNNCLFEKVPDYFTDDFVADYSPRVVRKGYQDLIAMVKSAHDTFEQFHEEVHTIIATDTEIVVHFTISGRQVGEWGGLPATGKPVRYDEIVIMSVREGRVFRQVGISDALLALQQIGLIPDPGRFGEKALSKE